LPHLFCVLLRLVLCGHEALPVDPQQLHIKHLTSTIQKYCATRTSVTPVLQ
jgi:hypothetical protein